MKKLCVLAAALLSLQAFADNNQGFYAGVGGALIDDEQDDIEDLKRIKAQEFFGGYKYNEWLGVELRLGNGRSTGTASSTYLDASNTKLRHFSSTEREIGHYTSIYYKPELVNEEAKLYALIGYTALSTEGTTTDEVKNADGSSAAPISTTKTRITHSGSGFSYGLGVGFIVAERINLNIEYRNICNDISGKPNLLGVNVDYRF